MNKTNKRLKIKRKSKLKVVKLLVLHWTGECFLFILSFLLVHLHLQLLLDSGLLLMGFNCLLKHLRLLGILNRVSKADIEKAAKVDPERWQKLKEEEEERKKRELEERRRKADEEFERKQKEAEEKRLQEELGII
jgi:hypothetical protein